MRNEKDGHGHDGILCAAALAMLAVVIAKKARRHHFASDEGERRGHRCCEHGHRHHKHESEYRGSKRGYEHGRAHEYGRGREYHFPWRNHRDW